MDILKGFPPLERFSFRYSPLQVSRLGWTHLLGGIVGRVSLYEDSPSDTSHPRYPPQSRSISIS